WQLLERTDLPTTEDGAQGSGTPRSPWASCSGRRGWRGDDRPSASASASASLGPGSRGVPPESARGVVAEDLSLARLGDGLLLQARHAPRPGAVGMRIVGVEGEVVVAGQRDGSRQGPFVAPAGDEDVAPEVFRRSHLQMRVLGVAGEVPVLLHALEQIRYPAGVGLDVHDAQPREAL